MEKYSVKAKIELFFIKIMSIDPVINENSFISDTHHVYADLKIQEDIMIDVFFNVLSDTSLRLIDLMYVTEDALYKRLKPIYVPRVKLFNRLVKDLAKSGVSIKNIDFGNGCIFKEAYESRTDMFKDICNKNPGISFKTKKHYDEDNDPMFNGSFLVGLYTPLGIVTYHFKLKYFDMFNIPEIEKGPQYDNYSVQDCLYRLASLVNENKVKEHLRERSKLPR